jgi:hypothetical protein
MRISIDRLTALDQLMLRASTAWPQDIGALALLDGANLLGPNGRLRIEAVREAIESRLQLVPRFRQVVYVPRRGLGGPLWVDAPSFELGDHLRVHPLPAGSGEADLLVAIERLRRQPLDPARPLWELWFLTGLPNRQVALFVRLHHAIADGMASMTIVAALLDPAPDAAATPAPPWTPTPQPSARRLLADNLRRISSGSPAPSPCLPGLGPSCSGCERPGRPYASSSPKRPRPNRAWTAWSVPAAPSP